MKNTILVLLAVMTFCLLLKLGVSTWQMRKGPDATTDSLTHYRHEQHKIAIEKEAAQDSLQKYYRHLDSLSFLIATGSPSLRPKQIELLRKIRRDQQRLDSIRVTSGSGGFAR